jgi:hypothetical protein
MADEKRHLIRGIAAEEGFLYEIALTALQKLRKIRSIHKQKKSGRPAL